MILGLTMAETVLLLLFSLLLALAALLKKETDKRDQLTEEVQTLLSRADQPDQLKELVRLETQEKRIKHLLKHLKLPSETDLPEQLDVLVEKVSKLEEVATKVEEAGLPPDPDDLEAALEGGTRCSGGTCGENGDRKRAGGHKADALSKRRPDCKHEAKT